MIAAGFLPACAAAWHRGVLELVRQGWWSDLPGADRWPPAAWLAVPAAIVVMVAIAAAATSRARAWIVVLGLAGFVHPWLSLVLLPLALTVRAWPDARTLRTPAIVATVLWMTAFTLTPGCGSAAPAAVPFVDVVRAWWLTVGLAAGALLMLDVLFSRTARRRQLAALIVLLLINLLLVSGLGTDLPALIGTSAVVLWWRVIAGAGHVIAWQHTTASRVGAVLLIALVPALTAARAGEVLRPAAQPAVADVWRALEEAGSPAVVLTTGGRADVAAAIWRSGAGDPDEALRFIAPEPEATSPYLATSAVLAWESTAREMAMRGMLVAPLTARDGRRSLLWRVLQFESCQPLTASWVNIDSVAAGGQFAGVFPLPDPSRAALVYLGSPVPLDPLPLEWPQTAGAGFERRTFSRESSESAAALAEAMRRDGLAANALGAAPFVTRLRVERRGLAPSTLPVSLGGVATAAWARLYTRPDERPGRQPAVCRSSIGQPVAAYSGAPPTVRLDITSPLATGSGWHAPEGGEGDRFRWTGGHAQVLFVAHRAQPLVLRLEAEPAGGDWSSAQVAVTLNGVAARCQTGEPPCGWLLPPDAVRTGLNVITIGSVAVPAPPPDPRQLGLMVRGAMLERVE